MVAKTFQKRRKPLETKDDIDLEHRLVNFLHARHVPGRRSVDFNVRGGTVVVSGPLDSARAKWLCVECCRHVAGVIRLVDEVVIERPQNRSCVIDSKPATATKPRS
jgi:osmotically-inducible protein OsmY